MTEEVVTTQELDPHDYRFVKGLPGHALIKAVEIISVRFEVSGSEAHRRLLQAAEDLGLSKHELVRCIVEAPAQLNYLATAEERSERALSGYRLAMSHIRIVCPPQFTNQVKDALRAAGGRASEMTYGPTATVFELPADADPAVVRGVRLLLTVVDAEVSVIEDE